MNRIRYLGRANTRRGMTMASQITPNEIRNKTFERGVSGFKIEDVRVYLEKMAEYVEDLQDERNELQKKMEVLADKLEEYREDEESLRAALIGAQKLGDSVVRESKKKAEAILAEATQQAEALVSDARNSIDREQQALAEIQREVAKFKTQILSMYKTHIEMIKNIPGNEDGLSPAPEKPAAPPVPTPKEEGLKAEQQTEISEEEPKTVLLFDDFKSPGVGAEEQPRRKSAKFGQLNEYFGDKNPINRKE